MISSLTLNSMMHHQTSPSPSTVTNTQIRASSSDNIEEYINNTTAENNQLLYSSASTTTSHDRQRKASTSPKAYIFNSLHNCSSEKLLESQLNSPSLKRKHESSSHDEVIDTPKRFLNNKNDGDTLLMNKNEKEFDEHVQASTAGDTCESPRNENYVNIESQMPQRSGVLDVLEAQKAIQKFTSQLSGLNQRNPFQNLGTISPFLVAALHQQHHNLQSQLLATSNGAINEKSAEANKTPNPIGLFNSTYLNASPFTAALRLAAVNSNDTIDNNPPARNYAQINDDVPTPFSNESHSRNSPLANSSLYYEEDNDDVLYRRIEPEDLSLRERDIDETGSTAPSNWSWEEQFKQLYELSNESERKDWLNDWLSFMHRIGKPVTRIPIMAKQVLDLYELYRLVVQHGGLVEIINKKLWREITKGLNLPNSITSAAFTLRTQYQKYLYDYECDRENLSCLADLQAAIEGNKRDGRRANPSDMPNSTSGSAHTPTHLTQLKTSSDIDSHRRNSNGSAFSYGLGPSMTAFFGKGLDESDGAFVNIHSNNVLPSIAQFELLHKAALSAAMAAGNLSFNNNIRGDAIKLNSKVCNTSKTNEYNDAVTLENERFGNEKNRELNEQKNIASIFKNSTTARLKLRNVINSTSDFERDSMRVSMELNGQVYEGILFATESVKSNYNSENMPNNVVEAEENPQPSFVSMLSQHSDASEQNRQSPSITDNAAE